MDTFYYCCLGYAVIAVLLLLYVVRIIKIWLKKQPIKKGQVASQ